MKKFKLITAVIAILMFSNFILAVNPNPETADEISNTMVENLDKDVALTTVQKETIKKKAKDYAVSLLQARTMSDKIQSYAYMSNINNNYQSTLDSVLTFDQKAQKEKKFKERLETIVTKINSIK